MNGNKYFCFKCGGELKKVGWDEYNCHNCGGKFKKTVVNGRESMIGISVRDDV